MSSQEVELAITQDQLWRYGYWVALGAAAVLLLVGLSNGNHNVLISSCFLGIVSRILQAEWHFQVQLRKRISEEP